MELRDKTPPVSSMLMLASIAVVIGALYLAKGVLVPFTLAVLLSFLLSPVCDWLERRRLGRIPAVLVTTTLGFIVLGLVAWIATIQITNFAPKIPEYRKNIEAKLSSVNEYAVAALSKLTSSATQMGRNLSPSGPASTPQGTDEQPFAVRVLSAPASPWQIFGGMFGTLLEVLGTTGIVIVFVIFFLLRRDDLRDRFIHLAGKSHVTMTTQMLEDAGARVSRYLVILFFLNVTFGICVGVGLYFIGVPNAVLWGILAGLLRFIPYLGPWLAAVMPVALSMAISTGWAATILTALLFLVLELFNNNLLEPWLYGKNTGVSPVAVMLAALFWTWLWGPVGLLLATPLTVCVLVVGKHVPQLAFLDTLLGNEPVFEPKMHVYQRLLAGDQEEAAELFENYLEHQPLAQVYDTVLIPALAMAETDWQLGELNEGKHRFILQSLQEMIHDRDEVQLKLPTAEQISDPSKFSILCLPARTEADEITALMLAQVVETVGCIVEAVSITSLAEEMVAHVDLRKPNLVCVSATPPAAVMHARHLCKQLRGRFPKVQLIVGLWDSQADLTKARERIGCGAIVVATLAEAQEQVRLLIQPHQANSPQLVNANDKPSKRAE